MDRRPAGIDPHDRLRRAKAVIPVALLVAALFSASALAYADVPTITDVAACNADAHDTVRGGTASPTTKDEARAADARKDLDPIAKITQSADPQIAGMDGDGAKNAAYRAAYRVCMRKKGF